MVEIVRHGLETRPPYTLDAVLPPSVPPDEYCDLDADGGFLRLKDFRDTEVQHLKDDVKYVIRAMHRGDPPTIEGARELLKQWIDAQSDEILAKILSESEDEEFRQMIIRSKGRGQ